MSGAMLLARTSRETLARAMETVGTSRAEASDHSTSNSSHQQQHQHDNQYQS